MIKKFIRGLLIGYVVVASILVSVSIVLIVTDNTEIIDKKFKG